MVASVIHKRVTSTKKLESFDYQLCAAVRFNDNTQPDGEWKKSTRCHWRLVTCSTCLWMKGDKHKSLKKIISELAAERE